MSSDSQITVIIMYVYMYLDSSCSVRSCFRLNLTIHVVSCLEKNLSLKFCPRVFAACIVWIVSCPWLVNKFISMSSLIHRKMQVEFMAESFLIFQEKCFFLHLTPIKQWVLQQQYLEAKCFFFLISLSQALAKQFAEILHFTLKFDDLKV